MQPIEISAIIIGNWNPKIFTPFWIKTQLFETQNVQDEIKISLDFNDLELSYRYQNMVILPRRNLLEIKVESLNKFYSNEQQSEELFAKILIKIFALLPQTPIKAMGINVTYLFNSDDSNPIVKSIMQASSPINGFETDLIRQSKTKENYVINLITERVDKKKINVTVNFHYPKLIQLAKEFIYSHINESQKILNLEYE